MQSIDDDTSLSKMSKQNVRFLAILIIVLILLISLLYVFFRVYRLRSRCTEEKHSKDVQCKDDSDGEFHSYNENDDILVFAGAQQPKTVQVKHPGFLSSLLGPHPPSATPEQVHKAKQNFQQIMDVCGTVNFMPGFNPAMYNDPRFQRFTNCYMMGFADLNLADSEKWRHKPQPGQLSGKYPIALTPKELTLDKIVERVLADHPTAIWIPRDSPQYKNMAPCGSWKTILLLDDGSNPSHRDYHFVRQGPHSWTHKAGASPVLVVDAKGDYIVDIDEACFDYSAKGGVNYGKPRGHFYVFHEANQIFELPEYPELKAEQDIFPENYLSPL